MTPFIKYSDYLKEKFKKKVMKISIDVGQSCPHRKSRKNGGCFYCNPESFTPPEAKKELSVEEQIEIGRKRCYRKYKDCLFIAYFQAYTPTIEKKAR